MPLSAKQIAEQLADVSVDPAAGAVSTPASYAVQTMAQRSRAIDMADELAVVQRRLNEIKRAQQSGSHLMKSGHLFVKPKTWAANAGSLSGRLRNAVIEGGGWSTNRVRVRPDQADDFGKQLSRIVKAYSRKAGNSPLTNRILRTPVLRAGSRLLSKAIIPVNAAFTLQDLHQGWKDPEAAQNARFSLSSLNAPGRSGGAAMKMTGQIQSALDATDKQTKEQTDTPYEIVKSLAHGLFKDKGNRRIYSNAPTFPYSEIARGLNNLVPDENKQTGETWDVSPARRAVSSKFRQLAEKASNAISTGHRKAVAAAMPFGDLIRRALDKTQAT